MVKIIDNCCSTAYLDCLKQVVLNSENWHLKYPTTEPETEKKFLKQDIIVNGMFSDPFLSGLALGLLLQIHERGGQELFFPEINVCGISIKDKHTSGDHMHVDEGGSDEEASLFVRVVGLLNSDWKEEWGGGFFHDETSYYAKPTSFYIFDGSRPHMSEEIVTDKKRFAIDFTVFKDQQSKELYYQPHQLQKET